MARTRMHLIPALTLLLTTACAPDGRERQPGGTGLSFGDDGSDFGSTGGSDEGTATDSPDDDAGSTGEDPDAPADSGAACEPPVVDSRRALIETELAALADWSLAEVLSAIATNAGLAPDPQGTHDQLFDTYRRGEQALFPGAHCDDADGAGGNEGGGGDEGGGIFNGFPLQCPRPEGAFATFPEALEGWLAIAVVNRVDLAPVDGSHCGEQRIVLANPNMVGRAFIIIEAQIPNPSPACGVAACEPIARAWAELGALDDPQQRSDRLRAAFLDGDATLTAAGFSPFMSADNLTFGTGQVRTNNFVQGPWTLREYKLVPRAEGGQQVVRAQPVPVAASAHDALWNDQAGHPAGPACRTAMLEALPGLLGDDVATMGWSLPEPCLDAESAEGTGAYADHLAAGSGAFTAALDAEIQAVVPGSPLRAADVARRAQFAGSCIGCHEPPEGLDLGGGLVAPASMGFVHVEEHTTEPCGSGLCFAISPALRDALLPHRREVMIDLMFEACEGECQSQAPLPPGHALPPPGLDLGALRALDRAARPSGLTLGGSPAGGH